MCNHQHSKNIDYLCHPEYSFLPRWSLPYCMLHPLTITDLLSDPLVLWFLILICFSLKTTDVVLCAHWPTIQPSSFVKSFHIFCLFFFSFCLFFFFKVGLSYWVVRVCFVLLLSSGWYKSFVRYTYLQTFFCPSMTCLFIFLLASCKEQTLNIYIKSVYQTFFMAFAFCVLSKKSLRIPVLQRFSFVFTSRSLIVVAFTFRSVMHFSVCVWCEVRVDGQFSHMWMSSCSSTICQTDFAFPIQLPWHKTVSL